MSVTHYIGFDVHKKIVQDWVKTAGGEIVAEGKLRALRPVLIEWARRRTEPWRGAMEATLFSGWIYDTLEPYAAELDMAHPLMMKAIGAPKEETGTGSPAPVSNSRHFPAPTCFVCGGRPGPLTAKHRPNLSDNPFTNDSSPYGFPAYVHRSSRRASSRAPAATSNSRHGRPENRSAHPGSSNPNSSPSPA